MKTIIATLLLAVGVLLMLGTVILFSATMTQPHLARLNQHLWSMLLGAICCALAATFNYTWLQKFHLPAILLGFALGLLLAVFVPGIGVTKNAATRWLFFGQPSEFAKLALIIFLADYCARHRTRMEERTIGFARPGMFALLIGGLVFLEPDWGSAGLLVIVALAMLYVGGAHWGYLLATVIVGSELFTLLLLRNQLRLERVLAFLHPDQYQDGAGWQAWQALLSLAKGGLFGASLGEGSHKYGFVPEEQTDFVLALIGEELGYVGTMLVLVLFVCVIICGMRIANRAAEPFGRLLAFGLTFLIGAQALINIGVVTSSLPNKGIALPFVSYGGSGLVIMLSCVGLLISIGLRAHEPVKIHDESKSTAIRAKTVSDSP